jgi:putative PIN family toxin of toxin-antitoxin system
VTSATLLAELAEVIAREKFFSRVVEAGLTAGELVRDFADLSEVVEALPLTTRISRDPEDDHVLACACAASADLIVSGDRDLLALESFQGIPVVTATKALDRMLRA